MLVIDFETEGIVGNPILHPPKPVGVAIKKGDTPSRYFAWGHPSENNCTFEEGKAALLTAIRENGHEWLGHNSQFECAVLREHFGYVPTDPLQVHDTMFLLFLANPYAYTFSLKPSAESILGMPPDEQDDLREWILAHVPEATAKTFGAYICRAPGDLVGRYACGDVDRTLALYQKLMPYVEERDMKGAYEREQRLAPILSASSVRGVRLDTSRLERDIPLYRSAQKYAEQYIFKTLGGEFELSKDAQLAAALERADMVTEWVYTPTGKKSTARKNLVGRIKDPELLKYLAYYGILETCLGTFAEPWLRNQQAGRLHPQWNQVRGEKGEGGDMTGTRTGRMSCKDPNLQNIPNDFEGVEVPLPIQSMLAEQGLTSIIHMRAYLLPELGHTWLKRDFSAQEMRIMAHFAEGKLYEAFLKDPLTDPHVAVQKIIKELLGIEMLRKHVKVTGFGIMYGRGVPNLSAALGVPMDEGKALRDAYYAALPEIRDLSDACRRRGRSGGTISTWGGRRYGREPNPDRDLSYKLLNYLIQGSAADQTKQSIIDWDAGHHPDVNLIAAVHDEINISAPTETVERDMKWLREAMDAPRFDVPFASEGFKGPNWADIEEYDA